MKNFAFTVLAAVVAVVPGITASTFKYHYGATFYSSVIEECLSDNSVLITEGVKTQPCVNISNPGSTGPQYTANQFQVEILNHGCKLYTYENLNACKADPSRTKAVASATTTTSCEIVPTGTVEAYTFQCPS